MGLSIRPTQGRTPMARPGLMMTALILRMTEDDCATVLANFNGHNPIVALSGLEHGGCMVSGGLLGVESRLVDNTLSSIPDDGVGHRCQFRPVGLALGGKLSHGLAANLADRLSFSHRDFFLASFSSRTSSTVDRPHFAIT